MAEGFRIASGFLEIHAESDGLRREVSVAITEAGAGQDIRANVRADSSGLRAETSVAAAAAGAGQDIKVKVKTDKSDFDVIKREIQSAGAQAGDAFGSVFSRSALIGFASFGLTSQQLLGAPILAIGAVSQAVEQLGGALGLLPALVAAAGASLAAIKIGTSGISDAVKAYTKDQDTATGSSASFAAQQLATAAQNLATANSLISANNAVRNAEQGLADARVSASAGVQSALDGVASAERALINAEESELDARRALNDAYQQSLRNLQDLEEKASDYAMTEEDATLSVAEAQERLRVVNENAASTDLQKQRAALSARQAQERLDDLQKQNVRTVEDLNAAEAKGVAGSDQVVAAQKRVTNAHQATIDASAALIQAHNQVSAAQVAGDRQVAAAQESLASATRSLAQTQAQAAAAAAQHAAAIQGATGPMAEFDKLMAKLPSEAQAGVLALIRMKDAWTELKLPIQQALWQGLDKDIDRISMVTLPVLSGGLTRVAGGWNDVAHQSAAFLTSGPLIRDLGGFLDNVGLSVHKLAPGFVAVLDILRNIIAVGGELLPGLAGGFSAAAERAKEFIQNARDTGKLKEWIQGGIDGVKEFGRSIWNVLVTLHDLGAVAGEVMGGRGLLGGIENVTRGMRDFIREARESGKLKEYMQAGADALRAVWHIVVDLVAIFLKLGTGLFNLLPIVVGIVSGFRWMVDNIPGFVPVLGLLFLAFKALQIVMVFVKFIESVRVIIALVKAWEIAQMGLNLAMLANPIGLVIIAVLALAAAAYLIITHWDTVKGWLSTFWNWIVSFFQQWGPIILAILVPFLGIPLLIYQHWGQIVGWLSGIWNSIWSFLSGILHSIVDLFWWLIAQVAIAINWFGGLPRLFWDWLNSVGANVRSGLDYLVALFFGVPRLVLNALGDLGRYLWNAGVSLVSGFWDGIVSRWDQMVDWVRRGLSNLRDLWPFSPAKTGPFSGTGYVTYSGQALTTDFAQSIVRGIPTVVDATRRLATAAALQLQKPGDLVVRASGGGPVTAGAGAAASAGVEIGTLVLNVAGNLDPSNPVAWRNAMENIRAGIRNVERSYR